jgi:hypothetical protein
MMLSIFSGVSNLWGDVQARKSREQVARTALEAISRDVRTAAFATGTHLPKSLVFLISPETIGAALLSPEAAFWQAKNPTSPTGFADIGYFIRWSGDRSELCQVRIPHDDPDSIFTNIEREISSGLLDRLAPGSADNNLRGLIAENVVGLWFKPLDFEGNLLSSTYDSRVDSVRPSYINISIAVIDPTTSDRQGDAAIIREAYSDDPQSFLDALPQPLARGVRIFSETVPIHAHP